MLGGEACDLLGLVGLIFFQVKLSDFVFVGLEVEGVPCFVRDECPPEVSSRVSPESVNYLQVSMRLLRSTYPQEGRDRQNSPQTRFGFRNQTVYHVLDCHLKVKASFLGLLLFQMS